MAFIRRCPHPRALDDDDHDAAGDHSFPFEVQREQLGTIDGDMEAFYAVLSANFLEERIDARLRSTSHHGGEVGALDMGEDGFRVEWSQWEGNKYVSQTGFHLGLAKATDENGPYDPSSI